MRKKRSGKWATVLLKNQQTVRKDITKVWLERLGKQEKNERC